MSVWRERIRSESLPHWDRLVAAARGATPLDGLPDGLNTNDVLMTVLLVAEAKGLARITRHADSSDIQIPPRGRPAANAIMARSTGNVQAWSGAVRAVDAIEADPDPEATFRALDAQPPTGPTGPQPVLSPQMASALADRILAAEAGLRRHEVQRSVFAPKGQPAGIAWLPLGAPPPEKFDPKALFEWATPAGSKGYYVPMWALPDLLMALGIAAGAFLLAETPAEDGPTALVLPAPGHEAEFERLNDLRLGKAVPADQVFPLLERWTAPRAAALMQ